MITRRDALPLLASATLGLPTGLRSASAQDAPAFSQDPGKVRPSSYELDSAHGRVTWSLNHLGFSRYAGQFVGVTGRLEIDEGEQPRFSLRASIPLDGLRTNDEALDRELRGQQFFDAARHPAASFASTRVDRRGDRQARAHGDLTLRGVTKPVTLHVTFNQAGIHPVTKRYTLGFDGRAAIRRSAFGMTAMLPALGDEVTLQLEGEFQRLG